MFTQNSVKDIAFQSLIEGQPLTVKAIKVYIHKRGRNVSYQSIHKVLNNFIGQEIVEKGKFGYKISDKWVNKTEQIINRIKLNNQNKNTIFNIKLKNDGDTEKYTLNSLFEVREFRGEIIKNFFVPEIKHLPFEKRPSAICQYGHLTTCFVNPLNVLQSKYMKPDFKGYYLIKGNSPLDKFGAKLYKEYYNGDEYKLGVKMHPTKRIIIHGDYVMEVFYPEEIIKLQDEYFKKVKKIKDLNSQYFLNQIYIKPTKIKLIVHKDKDLAKNYGEEILEDFYNGKGKIIENKTI